MKHDFTSIPDRSKFGSAKWEIAPNASTEYVPLSVADMEFPTAKPIINALKKLCDEAILGYTNPTDEYYDAVCSWMKRRHNFEINKDWMIQTPGIINALSLLIETVTKPGDGVIILSPVYYPFDMTVLATNRHIVYCPLLHKDGKYEIDYKNLLLKAQNTKNTALLFCNPHNPIGKVWSKEELEKVGDICCKNNVFIIDDEIHNDLIMPGYEHTVMATVNNEIKNNIAVCTAPSKTFNLAGVQCSNIIIPNEAVRAKAKACNLINMQMHLNIFAYTACTAAYNECEDWLDELIKVIADNAKLVEDFMAENFPQIKVYPLEGTYLQWLDVRNLGFNHIEIREILENANIYLDNGEMFGPLGRGFQRINLACAKSTIKKMLARFKTAVDEALKVKKEETTGKLIKGQKIENFVYNSANGEKLSLNPLTKTTLLVFARDYRCSITQKLLGIIKAAYHPINLLGYDIKFVVQSDLRTVTIAQGKYPFELIADPDAELYKKYDIFEADSPYNFVAGDKVFEATTGKDIRRHTSYDAFNPFVMKTTPSNLKYPLQLCAFVAVNKESDVIYSHYCKTMADFPNIKELIEELKNNR